MKHECKVVLRELFSKLLLITGVGNSGQLCGPIRWPGFQDSDLIRQWNNNRQKEDLVLSVCKETFANKMGKNELMKINKLRRTFYTVCNHDAVSGCQVTLVVRFQKSTYPRLLRYLKIVDHPDQELYFLGVIQRLFMLLKSLIGFGWNIGIKGLIASP